jgi:hypothetical protein
MKPKISFKIDFTGSINCNTFSVVPSIFNENVKKWAVPLFAGVEFIATLDIERRKNRLFKFCYVPASSSAHSSLLF